MTIPKTIHRLWLNPPGPVMPDEFVQYGNQWRKLHPDWTVIDWTELGSLFPLMNQSEFDTAPSRDLHRIRAGLVRLELVYRLGGVYVDADMEPLRSIDDLLHGRRCLVAESANRMRDGSPVLSDSFMAGEPGHPLFLEVIRQLPGAMKALANHPRAAVELGPYHLDRVYRSRRWADVTVLEPHILYPQNIKDRDAGKTPDLSRSYAWHKWANSRRT